MKSGIYLEKEQVEIRAAAGGRRQGRAGAEPLFQYLRHRCCGFHPRSEHRSQGECRR